MLSVLHELVARTFEHPLAAFLLLCQAVLSYQLIRLLPRRALIDTCAGERWLLCAHPGLVTRCDVRTCIAVEYAFLAVVTTYVVLEPGHVFILPLAHALAAVVRMNMWPDSSFALNDDDDVRARAVSNCLAAMPSK